MFEKVNPAHPDKLADRIAGALVDVAYDLEKKMYSLSRKQANECSIRSTGTNDNYSIDTIRCCFFVKKVS